MRRISFLISIVGITCVSWAQSHQAVWANLGALQPGQKIQIVDIKTKKHSGTFVSVSESAISYRDDAGEQTLQRPDVRSVRLMANRHRLRNAVIGGAGGAGIGAGIGAATFHPCSASQTLCIQPGGRGAIAGFGAVVGLVAGAVFGVLFPSHKMIYRASRPGRDFPRQA
jgi:hypothetical protein